MTAAQGTGLTDSEREALMEAYCRHSAEGRRQVGHYRCEMYVSEAAPTVAAIRDAAVVAALTAAAEAIESWRDMHARWAESDKPNERGRERAKVRVLAYGRAARIVRAQIEAAQ